MVWLRREEDKKKDLADEVENIQAQRQSVEIEKAEKTAEHEENMRYMYKVYASLLTAVSNNVWSNYVF